MNRKMKRVFCLALFVALSLALLMPSCALAERKWFPIEGENASICFGDGDKYTFVTPETLEENMALCLSHGGTAEDARERFRAGNVMWEAYREGVEGRFRLEIYEDEWTHYAWDSQTMSLSLLRQLPEDLKNAGWLAGRYDFMNMKYHLDDGIKHLEGKFTSQLPYAYESGVFTLHFYNGKAFLFLYADSKPASVSGLWSQSTYNIVWKDTLYRMAAFFRRDSKALAEGPHMVDLLPNREDLVLNLHSGPYALKGITEKGASVALEYGGEHVEAKVKEREYQGEVTLNDGDGALTLRARKGNQPENVLEMPLPVNDAMAALVLTACPNGSADRDNLRVKGRTDPRGGVTVQVDEEAPIQADVQADGSFDVPIQAEDWVYHTLLITASQEGLEDCAARFSFTPTYEDAEKGIRAYRKTLSDAIKPLMLMENPEAYVGSRYSFEVKILSWTIYEGIITMTARFDSYQYTVNGQGYTGNICLLFDSYMDDFFRAGQKLTVYGEVLEPTRTDPPMPRMQVQYAEYVIGSGGRY